MTNLAKRPARSVEPIRLEPLHSKRWESDLNGTVHTDKHSPGPCQVGFSEAEWAWLPGTQIGVLNRFAPKCGRLVISEAILQQPDKMVTRLNMIAIDSKRMFDQLNAQKNKAADAKQKQINQEKAQGIKPQL